MKKFLKIPVSLLLLASISACSNTGGGALLGGALGATIARATGADNGQVAAGAIVGAGLGAAIGNYMDKQRQELEGALVKEQAEGVQISQLQDGSIKIFFPAQMAFATNSPTFYPGFASTLDKVAEILVRYPKTMVEAIGHTDSTGAYDYNMNLSKGRATSVSRYLAQRGVAAQRLLINGYGPQYPIADNNTAEGKALNRRVELLIHPIPE